MPVTLAAQRLQIFGRVCPAEGHWFYVIELKELCQRDFAALTDPPLLCRNVKLVRKGYGTTGIHVHRGVKLR